MNFWEDGRSGAKIVHQRIERLDDGENAAGLTTMNAWIDGKGKVLLNERREWTVEGLPDREWQLTLDLRFEAAKETVVFGKTPFGLLGVRMAKTIGVNDGGGLARNSEGDVNEPGTHWRRARWLDYSGPIAPGIAEGITLFDHPSNSNHPTFFHVRNDGWMGASVSYETAITVLPGKPVSFRYRFYIHSGVVTPRGQIETHFAEFSKFPPAAGNTGRK